MEWIYPEIDGTRLAGGRLEIAQSAMLYAEPEDELLLLLDQSLTPLVHNVATRGSHHFFYA